MRLHFSFRLLRLLTFFNYMIYSLISTFSLKTTTYFLNARYSLCELSVHGTKSKPTITIAWIAYSTGSHDYQIYNSKEEFRLCEHDGKLKRSLLWQLDYNLSKIWQ